MSLEIFKQVLKGIKYLHGNKPPIIHRNLWTTNILIRDFESRKFIRIADFCSSTYHEYDGQMHKIDVGHLRTMAPEVWIGENYNTKADVYSLGVILYHLFKIEDKE